MLNLVIGAVAILFGIGVMFDEIDTPKKLESPRRPMESELDELERMEKELRQEVERCL